MVQLCPGTLLQPALKRSNPLDGTSFQLNNHRKEWRSAPHDPHLIVCATNLTFCEMVMEMTQ